MKIAIIADILYPYRMGGTSTVSYNLIKYATDKQNEIHLFGSVPKGTDVNELKRYYDLSKTFVFKESNLFSVISNQVKIAKLLVKNNYDIIHFEILPGFRAALLVKLIKKLSGKVSIVQKIHGLPSIEVQYKDFPLMKRVLYRLNWRMAKKNINKLSSVIVVNSEYMESETKKEISKNKIVVIPNGVDLDTWKNKKATSKNKVKKIIFWGRLSEEKGVDILIEAMQFVLKDISCKLEIVGDGPQMDGLKESVNKKGLSDRVSFAGKKTQQQIVVDASTSDVAVFPSRYEPFGIMALEAMALGKPTITSNVGGLTDFVKDKENGLTSKNNPKELAGAIIKILKEATFSKKLSTNALKTANRLSWVNVMKEYRALYKKVKIQNDSAH